MKKKTILAELPVKEALRKSLFISQHLKVRAANGRSFNVGNLRVFAVHGCTCVRCGRKGDRIVAWEDKGGGSHIDLFAGDVLMTRDHIIPRSKHGPNTDWNYQPMCAKCNNKKANNETPGDRELAAFRKHWRNIHVKLHDNIFKIIHRWVPNFLWNRNMSMLVVKFREGYLHRLTYAIAKVTA